MVLAQIYYTSRLKGEFDVEQKNDYVIQLV